MSVGIAAEIAGETALIGVVMAFFTRRVALDLPMLWFPLIPIWASVGLVGYLFHGWAMVPVVVGLAFWFPLYLVDRLGWAHFDHWRFRRGRQQRL